MDKNISLDSILSDKTSGSSELLSRLNILFLEQSDNPKKIEKQIPKIKKELKKFTAIENYFDQLEEILQSNNLDQLKTFLKDFLINETRVLNKIYKSCKRYLINKDKILTLSNSRTLLEIFARLKGDNKNLKLTVCESSPGKEGIIFANNLSRKNITTNIIPDSAISVFIRKSDAVVIGADSVLASGNAINKVGSQNAAIICKYYKIPFYVITSKSKFKKQSKFNSFEKSADKTETLNFEEIDKNLITRIITD